MRLLRHLLLEISLLCFAGPAVAYGLYPFLTATSPAPWQFLLAAASLTMLVWLVERGWKEVAHDAKAEAEGATWGGLALVLLRPTVVCFGLLAARRITHGEWF